MAIMAALSLLCNGSRWVDLQGSYKGILRDRQMQPGCGLLQGPSIGASKLARLAIVLAPGSLVDHWHKTAQSCVAGAKDAFGADVDILVWKGDLSRNSIKAAYDSGAAVIWILRNDVNAQRAFEKTPEIAVAACIDDELCSHSSPKWDAQRSVVVHRYLTQATLELLTNATVGHPRHPLRLAFNGNFERPGRMRGCMTGRDYKGVSHLLGVAAKLRLFSSPDFLRKLVAEEVQQMMPVGLNVYSVTLRAGTLSSMVTGAGVVRMTLQELVSRMMVGSSELLRERISSLFGQAQLFDRVELLHTVQEELDTMPVGEPVQYNAQQAVRRLRESLEKLLTGTLPTCPITLEPIEPADVVVLSCCTGLFKKESLQQCLASGGGRCPLCRAPLGASPGAALAATEEAKAAAQAEADSESESEPEPEPAPEAKRVRSASALSAEEAQRRFEAVIDRLNTDKPQCVDGLVAMIRAFVGLEPSARILLCFSFDTLQGSCVRDLAVRLRSEVAGAKVSNLEVLVKDQERCEEAIAEFSDLRSHREPHIFFLSTKKNTESIQGLNLHVAHLSIIADECSQAVQLQACGRLLRMRPLFRGERQAAKTTVVISLG